MGWTGQVVVALLNIVWIIFFLTPEPFSVFVQRRSTNEEDRYSEFCIELPPVKIPSNKTNNTKTTSQGSPPELGPTTPGSPPELGPTTPGSPPELEATTPGSPPELGPTTLGSPPEQEATTPGSPPELGPTTLGSPPEQEATTPGSPPELGPTTLGSPPEQEATTPGSPPELGPTTPGRPPEQGLTSRGRIFRGLCCVRYQRRPVPLKMIKGYRTIQISNSMCHINAIIFYTTKGRQICANPDDEWVKKILRTIHERIVNGGRF